MTIQSIMYKKGSSGKIAPAKLIADHFKLNEIIHLPPSCLITKKQSR